MKQAVKNFMATANEKKNSFLENKALPLSTTLMTMGMMISTQMAFADSAQNLFELIIDILGKILVVVGAFLGIMGIVHYAVANSDGDGPAKRKATMEMASGVAVIVVSIAIIAAKSQISALLV